MKKLGLIIAVCSVSACIAWPTDQEIRDARCSAAADPGCSDAGMGGGGGVTGGGNGGGVTGGGAGGGVTGGGSGGGVTGGGTGGGIDAGVDAGSWTVRWRENSSGMAKFLVGDQDGGTIITETGGNFAFQSFTEFGPTVGQELSGNSPSFTSAYERGGTLVVGDDAGVLHVYRRTSNYSQLFAGGVSSGFVTTAVDLYPSGGGLAVAAYGNWDAGLGLHAFTAEAVPSPIALVNYGCTTTVLRPWRILPTPDGGPGVVVGNVSGSCAPPLNGINMTDGAFVGFFGDGVQSGYSFASTPDSPMTLGIVENDLWVVYQPNAPNRLEVAKVTGMGLSDVARILSGRLTPIDLVDIGADSVLVGYGSGTISLADGGLATQAQGNDVFIARMNSSFEVTDLQVFVAQGEQTVVGAVWVNNERLVMGGTCTVASGFCEGFAGATWLAGFDPAQP